jgi:L-fuconolactonase
VRRCPGTGFVLDHCGKPPVRSGELDPWRGHIRQLAGFGDIWCKVSGLLTEADRQGWDDGDLIPYAEHAAECFGTQRLIYGSDWPVLTLAARASEWYPFTRRLTSGWSPDERRGFYRDNALRCYGV